MTPVRFVVPGALDQATGGYRYDARIVAGLRARGLDVRVSELEGSFPFADSVARASAARCVGDAANELLVIDGLALPAFAGIALPRYVALIHHPHVRETDGAVDGALAELGRSERELTRAAARVVVTSPSTARELAAAGIERAAVVVPGVDPAPLAEGTGGTSLLCVATVTPRKGHAVLLEALAGLEDRAWSLTCAGSLARAPAHAAEILAHTKSRGLARRVTFTGEIDDDALAARYAAADVFVLPSHYEGYGMVLDEALARGLPIVTTRGGAIPETVPNDAALFVTPGSADELRAALAAILGEPALRERLRAAAIRRRDALPRWSDAVHAFAGVLEEARR